MLFSMGHAIHDAVQGMLEKNFTSFKSEGPAYYEPKPMDKTVRILTCCFLNKLALFA